MPDHRNCFASVRVDRVARRNRLNWFANDFRKLDIDNAEPTILSSVGDIDVGRGRRAEPHIARG